MWIYKEKKRQSLSLDYGKSFTIMTDEEITEVLKDIAGLVVFNLIKLFFF